MKRTWACSDLHGNYKIFNEIKKMIGPEDTVYVIGDVVDRGNYGWEILKEVLADNRFIMMMGNHEHMMLGAIGSHNYRNMHLWKYNGGELTHKSILEDNPEVVSMVMDSVRQLPYERTYTNKNNKTIHLSHSGYGSWKYNEPLDSFTTEAILWDRESFHEDWEWGGNEYVIHGHTPIPLMVKELRCSPPAAALWYCDNHKCCIDCGAIWTNQAVMIDLDTFEEVVVCVNE